MAEIGGKIVMWRGLKRLKRSILRLSVEIKKVRRDALLGICSDATDNRTPLVNGLINTENKRTPAYTPLNDRRTPSAPIRHKGLRFFCFFSKTRRGVFSNDATED